MSPTQHRYVFIGFTLLIAGVAVNVMALQPELPANAQGRNGPAARVESKAEIERRQRLALDNAQPAAGAMTAQAAAKAPPMQQHAAEAERAKTEVVKFDAARPAAGASDTQPTGPSRVAAGGGLSSSTTLPMPQGAQRFARLRPDAALANRPGDRLPDAPDAEGDPETIKAVQRELTLHGYGPVSADGVPGLVTRAAIMAFEFDQRMALTGEATERVLQRLLLGPSGNAAPDTAAGHVRSTQAELVMRTVQQSLAALGYQVGKIDGKPGEEIARAIREFELDEGLKPTGRVSAEVFSRLGRVVASAKPRPAQ